MRAAMATTESSNPFLRPSPPRVLFPFAACLVFLGLLCSSTTVSAEVPLDKAVKYLERTRPCVFWWAVTTMNLRDGFKTRVVPGDVVFCAYNGTIGTGISEDRGCVVGLYDLAQGGYRETINEPRTFGHTKRLPVLAAHRKCTKDLVLQLVKTEPQGRPFIQETRWYLNFFDHPRAQPQLLTGGQFRGELTKPMNSELDRLPKRNNGPGLAAK